MNNMKKKRLRAFVNMILASLAGITAGIIIIVISSNISSNMAAAWQGPKSLGQGLYIPNAVIILDAGPYTKAEEIQEMLDKALTIREGELR